MCLGNYADSFGISVADGMATITRDGVCQLVIPVLTMAKLYREGMAQHRREAERPEELARQWVELCEGTA